MIKAVNKFAAAALLVSMSSVSIPGTAGEKGLNDLQNAKVAYQIAKQRMMESRKTKEEREQDAAERDQSCGAIDIGNVRNERGARAPREIITVVRGDVINTGRCR